MKITKKQIKKVEKGELNIRDLFPELFSLEKNAWHIVKCSDNQSYLIYLEKIEDNYLGVGYGFDLSTGEFDYSLDLFTDEYEWKKAKQKKVNETLEKYAKGKYKVGDKITNIAPGNVGNLYSPKEDRFRLLPEDNFYFHIGKFCYGNLILFEDGKWAEIIEENIEYTLQDAMEKLKEFHKGKKVTIII